MCNLIPRIERLLEGEVRFDGLLDLVKRETEFTQLFCNRALKPVTQSSLAQHILTRSICLAACRARRPLPLVNSRSRQSHRARRMVPLRLLLRRLKRRQRYRRPIIARSPTRFTPYSLRSSWVFEGAILQARVEADLFYSLIVNVNLEVIESRSQCEREYLFVVGYLSAEMHEKTMKESGSCAGRF